MTFDELVTQLTAGTATAGNNAVVALDLALLNQFLWAQWAEAFLTGGNSGATQIDVLCYGASSSQLVSLQASLSPPAMQFVAGGTGEVTIESLINSGSLSILDLDSGAILSTVDLSTAIGSVSGTFPLAIAQGKDTLGSVTIDLGTSSNWTTELDTVVSHSTLATSINNAIAAYFAQTPFVYTLGTIAVPDGLPPYLTPTSFQMQAFPGSNGATGYLTLNVTTNGKPGSMLPPTPALIPDGSSAAILLQSALVANELVVPALNSKALSALGCKFTASVDPSNGTWTVSSSSGSVSTADPISTFDASGSWLVSSVTSTNQDSVITVPLALSATPGEAFTVSLDAQWSQWWNAVLWNSPLILPAKLFPVAMTASFALAFSCSANADSISFSPVLASPHAGIPIRITPTPIGADGLNFDPSGKISGEIDTALAAVGSDISFPDVNEFCLTALAFPNGGLLQLTAAALPADLVAAGTITPSLPISPGTATIGVGGQQSFTVASPSPGAIAFTLAPAVPHVSVSAIGDTATVVSRGPLAAPKRAILSATEGAGGPIGAAVVELTPQPAQYRIVPVTAFIPAGGEIQFSLTDATGNPQSASSISASAGSITYSRLAQTYTYTAPGTPTTVTVTAILNGTTLTTTWTVAATAALDFAAAPDSVVSGHTATFSLTGVPSGVVPAWAALTAAGTPLPAANLTPSADGTSATFTAPKVTSAESVLIVAFFTPLTAGSTQFGFTGTNVQVTTS